MEKSKVYYTDFRAKLGEGLPLKLQRLIRTAGYRSDRYGRQVCSYQDALR